MTGHTATPWEWVLSPAWGYSALIGPNNSEVLVPGGQNDGDNPEVWMGEEMSEANAKFIVTACNAHDDLVAGLRLSRQYIEWAMNDAIDEGFETNAFIAKQDLKIIDAALASVER